MRFKNSTLVATIVLAFVCLGAPPLLAGEASGKYRWDIFNPEVDATTGVLTIAAGGHSRSQATFSSVQLTGDNSTITLTGHGTFELGESNDVTGGGTWETDTATGTVIGSGTYRVTGFVRFEPAPGTLGGVPGIVDAIGNLNDTRAGLVVLRIAYSDGEKGILVFSCNIAGPQAVFEGTTATKRYVDYYNAVYPDFTFGNTLFHVIHDQDDQGDQDE